MCDIKEIVDFIGTHVEEQVDFLRSEIAAWVGAGTSVGL
jgi:hypothetical protein